MERAQSRTQHVNAKIAVKRETEMASAAPVIDAAKRNNIVRLRELLYVGHGASKQEERAAAIEQCRRPGGRTPLAAAVARGNAEAARLLIECGASVSAATVGGVSVASACAHGGSVECAELLRTAGADFLEANADGATPLHHAAGKNNARMVRWLCAPPIGAPLEPYMERLGTPLAVALATDSTAAAHALIELGAAVRHIARTPGAPPAPSEPDKDALHIAALHGNGDAVQMLIARFNELPGSMGALNSAKCDQWRAVHIAAVNGHEDVLARLVRAGADVRAPLPDGGATPLHLACLRAKNAGGVRILIEAGADVNSRDSKGRTPLHVAAKQNNNDTLQRLVEAGATVDAVAVSGATPISIAASRLNERAIQIMRAGAPVPDCSLSARRRLAESAAPQHGGAGYSMMPSQFLLSMMLAAQGGDGGTSAGVPPGPGVHAVHGAEPSGRPKRRRQ